MSKHESHAAEGGLRKLGRYPVLLLCILFFAGIFALDLATPDRERSELENKTLTQRPSLSLENFSAQTLNSFFNSYTQYVKDQVAGRDLWISFQSLVETTVFQKTQSGGILLGKEKMMFPRTFSLLSGETRTFPRNMAALESLAQRYPGRVNVMVVPSAASIYPENLPASAPVLDEAAYLLEIKNAVEGAGGSFIEVQPVLSSHKDEYIYYRTDHHWTTLGAWYAYDALCDALGLVPFDLSAHTAVTVENFYGTHYSKARTWNAEPDAITYYDLPNQLTVYTVTGTGMPESGETGKLYDLDKFGTYDKYAAFLRGNNGLSRIEGDGEGKILVLKDSYANSFAPYLTANYEAVDVVDFRNYNYGLDALIEENEYDQILVLYSFDSFKSDPYLYRAGIAG